MSKRKVSTVPFVRGFVKPNEEDVAAALGTFPWHKGDRSKEIARRKDLSSCSCSTSSLAMLDDMCYFCDTDGKNKKFCGPLPDPVDDTSWLAHNMEAGQTFEEYCQSVTLRSGHLKPAENPKKSTIYLIPLLDSAASTSDWPEYGPSLEQLAVWTRAFYDREVVILPPAYLSVNEHGLPEGRSGGGVSAKRHKEVHVSHPATGQAWDVRGRFVRKHPSAPSAAAKSNTKSKSKGASKAASAASAAASSVVEIDCGDNGRGDESAPLRFQTHIDGLLSVLAAILHSCSGGHTGGKMSGGSSSSSSDGSPRHPPLDNAFCLMGVTMCDLYSTDGDLFIAGAAMNQAVGVAVFSFMRYHPHLRMHYQEWHDYKYVNSASDYSYYEQNEKTLALTIPAGVTHAHMLPRSASLSTPSKAEYFRRAGKLLTHELGHLFRMDHCIYYNCLMNGTGHLVEDFQAPPHLCVVCLRKMQFRLGFDVKQRYVNLEKCFAENGLAGEAKWVHQRVTDLEAKVKGEGGTDGRGAKCSDDAASSSPSQSLSLSVDYGDHEENGGRQKKKLKNKTSSAGAAAAGTAFTVIDLCSP